MQQTAGNAATVAAMSAAGTSTAHGRSSTAALPTLVEQGAPELPPYLRDMEAPGLSTAYGLTGDEFATATLADSVGRRDGVVAEIAAELAGRPESFYGSGRAFAVTGARGADRYDVTVRSPAPTTTVTPSCRRPRYAGLLSDPAHAELLRDPGNHLRTRPQAD
ncbi:hypothetical protein [Streptomyces sp. NBC_00582]|uniref:hypothetical protein n=1 Tax=Streptomyces sp. NBC_00582 TaxID=2975783 RepID=UPI002E811F2B|nr:hypothetical protein [Streptomyces sp. NBC_00582]WUB59768.1 hypothetical protein OG852_04860 [Streptomyces sp. NBC_00582]